MDKVGLVPIKKLELAQLESHQKHFHVVLPSWEDQIMTGSFKNKYIETTYYTCPGPKLRFSLVTCAQGTTKVPETSRPNRGEHLFHL